MKKNIELCFLVFFFSFQVTEALNEDEWFENANEFADEAIIRVQNISGMQGVCSETGVQAIRFANLNVVDDFQYCDIENLEYLKFEEKNDWQGKLEACYFENEKKFHQSVLQVTSEIRACIGTDCLTLNNLKNKTLSSCVYRNTTSHKTAIQNACRCSFMEPAFYLIQHVKGAIRNLVGKDINSSCSDTGFSEITTAARRAWGDFTHCKQIMLTNLTNSNDNCLSYSKVVEQQMQMKTCWLGPLEISRSSIDNSGEKMKACNKKK